MRKRPSKKIAKRTRKPSVAPRRPVNVPAYKYEELAARVALAELYLNRLRTQLDVQFVRSAQMQEEINALKNSAAASADLPPLPPLNPPTVES